MLLSMHRWEWQIVGFTLMKSRIKKWMAKADLLTAVIFIIPIRAVIYTVTYSWCWKTFSIQTSELIGGTFTIIFIRIIGTSKVAITSQIFLDTFAILALKLFIPATKTWKPMWSIKAKKTYGFFLSFLFIIHQMHANLIYLFIQYEFKESVTSVTIAPFFCCVFVFCFFFCLRLTQSCFTQNQQHTKKKRKENRKI